MQKNPDPLSPAELAKSLPPERQADFLAFVEKGDASEEFIAYLETDKAKAVQVAIDTVMDHHAIGFENVAHRLKMLNDRTPAKPGLLSPLKDLFNKKLRKPFRYEHTLTVRMQDGSHADIPYAVSFTVADRGKYKSFSSAPEGHVGSRLHLALRREALQLTPAGFAAAADDICERLMLATQDIMLDRYGLKILDVVIKDAALTGAAPVSASGVAAGKTRWDNAQNTMSNIRTLLEGLEKEIPVKKPLQLKKPPAPPS
ncbi:MAG: hypothetical protein ACAH80_15815 [Alphaproteobacteria bacterium]